jgi:GTP-binding protein HflX
MKNVLLVGIQLPGMKDVRLGMEELASLAQALDYHVVDSMVQSLDKSSPAFWIGKGKVFEIKAFVINQNIDLVIFNDELSPVHLRNITEVVEVEVIDRTMLILEIFRIRAKTKEAMLQVSLAQSQYLLPRIIGSNTSLSRQKSGTGSKGPGEKELEIKKRMLRNQIHKDKQELEALAIVRKTQRVHRKKEGIFQVAIVGYTNSGKSTLLNYYLRLSHQPQEKMVLQKDMLFATLETAARHIHLLDQPPFIMVDTVGFIRHLPHHLVEAFKSTLEEILDASLIIHVADASQKEYQTQIKTVNEVLTSLGVKDIPMVMVFNKIDLPLMVQSQEFVDALRISVEKETNMDRLTKTIFDMMQARSIRCHLLIPYEQTGLVNQLKKTGFVFEPEVYEAEGIRIGVTIQQQDMHRYEAFLLNEKMN